MGELKVFETREEQKGILTEEEKEQIAAKVQSLPKSEETEIYEEIKTNPESVDVDRTGYSKTVNVTYDAATETTRVEDIDDGEDGAFDDFDSELTEEEKIDYDVFPEDIKSHGETSLGDFHISDETAVELVKFVNDARNDKRVKFADLHEEIKEQLAEHLENLFDVAPNDHSEKANQVRNDIANALMKEFVNAIEIDKYVNSYNQNVEHLFDDNLKDISSIFKKYNEDTDKYLKRLIGAADTEEAKAKGEEILAAIEDSHEMERIKEGFRHIRIKKFDVEKPNRVFDSLHQAYTDPKYHIYNVYGCAMTLAKHLYNKRIIVNAGEARDVAIKILIVFCKVCQNYNPENAAEHAFMYYFTYNMYLLDQYKGETYEEYSAEYLEKIKGVIEVMKECNKY